MRPHTAHAARTHGTQAFPFGTSQEVPLGITQVRASRITYVGELGWELYVPIESTLLVCALSGVLGCVRCVN